MGGQAHNNRDRYIDPRNDSQIGENGIKQDFDRRLFWRPGDCLVSPQTHCPTRPTCMTTNDSRKRPPNRRLVVAGARVTGATPIAAARGGRQIDEQRSAQPEPVGPGDGPTRSDEHEHQCCPREKYETKKRHQETIEGQFPPVCRRKPPQDNGKTGATHQEGNQQTHVVPSGCGSPTLAAALHRFRASTWTMRHFARQLLEFQQSVQQEPLIPLGAPLDHVPGKIPESA